MSSKLPVALCIMAKLPRPGACKTRLVPALSYEDAASLSKAFVSDTITNVLEVASRTNARAWVAYTPAAREAKLRAAFGSDIARLAQRGDGFGNHLRNAIVDLLARGHRAVCVIGSDSPTLAPEALARAVEACDGSDRVVIGPATDGGYYLLGLARAHPALFEDIAWSTSAVAAQTLARARHLGLPVMQLRHWYDVDEPGDLVTLAQELRSRMPPGGYRAPATRSVFARLNVHLQEEPLVNVS
jgi:rSAM/selenodomain-associated transferase 1